MKKKKNILSLDKYFGLAITLLFGFYLRLYGLSDVAVNADESHVYQRWISKSLYDILIGDLLLNNHVLAQILAWLSISVAGDNLFILRWPSFCISVLGIAFIYKIAAHLFDHRIGLIAALLLAISPYAIFFSHSFRGNGGVIVIPILVYLLGLFAIRYNRWLHWIALGVVSALMMYNHLFTLFAYTTLLLLLIVFRFKFQPKKKLVSIKLVTSVLITGVIISILYSPILLTLIPDSTSENSAIQSILWVQRPEVSASIWYNLWLFNGFWQPGSQGGQGVYLLLIFIVVGTLISIREKVSYKALFLISWVLLPFLEIWLLQYVLVDFWARPPYLGYTLPPLLILASFGIAKLSNYWPFQKIMPIGIIFLSISLFVVLWYPTMREYYQVFVGADWQSIGDHLQRETGPNDLVVCHQYQHSWRDTDVRPEDLCTRTLNYRQKTDTALVSDVLTTHEIVYDLLPNANSGVTNRIGRTWVVVWGIPQAINFNTEETHQLGLTETNHFGRTIVLSGDQESTYVDDLARTINFLRSTHQAQDQQFIHNLMLAPLAKVSGAQDLSNAALDLAYVHQPNHPESITKIEKTEQLIENLSGVSVENFLGVNFRDELLLQGYNISSTSIKPGTTLNLTLFWQSTKKITQNYTIFVHLRDEGNAIIGQYDFQPFDGSYPTTNWQPGQSLNEVREFFIPPEFPSGQYNVVIGLYNQETLERLLVKNDESGENAVFLTSLTVE